METNILQWREARQISIVKILSDFGIAPKRQSSKAAWYLSPLRTEREASFCVSLQKNLWYDFGIAKGGNVIDLVIDLKSCSPMDARRYLSGRSSFFFNPHLHSTPEGTGRIEIAEMKEIQHPALTQYLKSRGITLAVARSFCKEVWYNYNGRIHFSIGLANSSGGWELRNKFVKNSTAPKSHSYIAIGKEKLLIFEGMFDLLSLAMTDKDLVSSSDCIILNSLSFLDKSFALLNKYQEIYSYLDNDTAGKEATRKLKESSETLFDCSPSYGNCKDLNEKLMLLRQQI